MIKAKVWKIQNLFEGYPKDDDLILTEEEITDFRDGEFIIEAVHLSVDPYMRLFMPITAKVGDTMIGEQIARVIRSRDEKYPIGTFVRSLSGWRSHTIMTSEQILRMPEIGTLSPSTVLGVLGLPGMTAYHAFLDICKPKAGEVVVVTAAAGAVGSIVGQIAKIKECKVIGCTGTDEKCKWLKDLGFDHAYNYKEVTLEIALKESAPDGVDCYFDNIGGQTVVDMLQHMKPSGRIAVVGNISQYNATEPLKCESAFPTILMKQLHVEGFAAPTTMERWLDSEKQLVSWINEGRLKYKETVTEGIENMYTAFRQLFTGDTIGKAIIKC